VNDEWDFVVGDGLDLSEDWGPGFGRGDLVALKDWPDFTYTVDEVEGETTEVICEDDPFYTFSLPTAALRKVVPGPKKPKATPWPEVKRKRAEIQARNAEAVQQAIERLEQVNQRLRDN